MKNLLLFVFLAVVIPQDIDKQIQRAVADVDAYWKVCHELPIDYANRYFEMLMQEYEKVKPGYREWIKQQDECKPLRSA